MKSYGVALPSDPKMIEYDPRAPYPVFVTFTPSITYWLSRPLPPAIDGLACPAVLELLTPGARYNVDPRSRPTGTRSSKSLVMFAPVVVVLTLTTSVVPTT